VGFVYTSPQYFPIFKVVDTTSSTYYTHIKKESFMDKPRLISAINHHVPHYSLDKIKELAQKELDRQYLELAEGIMMKQDKESLLAVIGYSPIAINSSEPVKKKK
jgi:hypothetical protein